MHLVVAFYASPAKIELLENLVNRKMRYAFQQGLRGETRPFLSRLPGGLYDIRCKKEVAPLVLRDLRAYFTEPARPLNLFRRHRLDGLDLSQSTRALALLHCLIALARKFTPLRRVQRASGDLEFQLPGWHYCFFLGAYPDAINELGQEVL